MTIERGLDAARPPSALGRGVRLSLSSTVAHIPCLSIIIFLLCIIMHLLLFLSPDWLTFCHMIISYKFTRFIFILCFLSDEGPMLKTLDYTIRIGSTPTFLYFDLYHFTLGYFTFTLFHIRLFRIN